MCVNQDTLRCSSVDVHTSASQCLSYCTVYIYQDTLRCSSVDVHTSASQCFAQIARENSLQNVTFVSHLLPTILSEFENRSASELNCLYYCLYYSYMYYY